MYKIVALIGEAGTGKDTLMQKILTDYPGKFNEIISCTTRPPREGEIDGVNYFFIDQEEFAYKVLNYEMLEATNFNDWFYGTSYDTLRSDVLNIGIFNPDGIRAIEGRSDIDLRVFKITCSDKIRLLRQLNREKNPNVDEIIRRYKTDKEDFCDLEFTYYEIENNSEKDLELGTYAILSQLGLTCEQGQNKLID